MVYDEDEKMLQVSEAHSALTAWIKERFLRVATILRHDAFGTRVSTGAQYAKSCLEVTGLS